MKKVIRQYEESPLTIDQLTERIIYHKKQRLINYEEIAKDILLAKGYVFKHELSHKYWLDFCEKIGIHWKIVSYLFDTALLTGKEININYFDYIQRKGVRKKEKRIQVLKLPLDKQRVHWFGDFPKNRGE